MPPCFRRRDIVASDEPNSAASLLSLKCLGSRSRTALMQSAAVDVKSVPLPSLTRMASRRRSVGSTVVRSDRTAARIAFSHMSRMSAPVRPSDAVARTSVSSLHVAKSARNNSHRRRRMSRPGIPISSLYVNLRHTAGSSKWSWFVAASRTVWLFSASMF